MLPLLLTQVNAGRLTLEHLVALTSENPARVFGLYPHKGVIRPGSDADFVLIDLVQERTLRVDGFLTKSRASARMFDGMTVRGIPVTTLLRGEIVYDQASGVTTRGNGRFVRPL